MHPHAAGAAVTGTRHTHRQIFKRRQRQEQFRAAVAFALALGTFNVGILEVVLVGFKQHTKLLNALPTPLSTPQTASSRRRAATYR